ncbi:uncharacterized protein involved in type VI secretion and phage assembly [Catenuloplanes nepalensis]|uniref:Uncharacterized protein involved in type VI secretion and phage assembly n=1 Tax=Catenuloplanes nepalensis TaxID=587533 RepID=A0ABT9MQ34_9ACTN|nr:phage baseplate assembly protein V [Catenuloplanes nepalensis]MDP9793191.1 uncharacterized protein involved in type VI secretion and phage assembly [Catenuloplanes nepalensis]
MTSALPRSRSTDQRYYGVAVALVAETDGDDEGRVKLTLPWFDDSTVTDWCRVAQLYAGGGYGAVFVPEVGDEVIVAFVHGDLRFPIVLGGLYNGVDKPPVSRRDGNDQKTIRTRHGHQILFDDRSSTAVVRVTSAAGHRVELDDAGSVLRLKAAPGASVSIEADGAITLASRTSVALDAPAVTLGTGAGRPAAFGDALTAHTHASAGSPAVFPVTPASGQVKTA